jgi:predicted metalloprotease with PDZ domain
MEKQNQNHFFSYRNTVSLILIFSRWILLFSLIVGISCHDAEEKYVPSYYVPSEINLSQSIYYSINLEDQSGDKFKVKAYMSGLSDENNIYQFASVVPGTYSISDFGRYVSRFAAFDKDGHAINTQNVGTNQWNIEKPEELYYLEYDIFETWDIEMDTPNIYRMAGTSLKYNHALLNCFGVFGYPKGLKNREILLSINQPSNWKQGTSLEKVGENLYRASNYDELADSPILLGNLTSSNRTIGNTEIGVYAYSAQALVSASEIMNEINVILNDADAFLQGLPVNHYNFLFHFEDRAAGALEHSYSSVYVLKDEELNEKSINLIRSIAAHEFFHVVTPLNIRSEIIDDFNFVTPTPSKHLWLYEGVTEWASDMMQYRNGSMTFEALMKEVRFKDNYSFYYDKTLSLTQISLKSYEKIGGSQFQNIYLKGALVAYLLDIRLLELSGGSFGLRELILKWIDEYGVDQPFSENQFFTGMVSDTYPEINDFIDKYIEGTVDLPMVEYFDLVGISIDTVANTYELNPTPTAAQSTLFDAWSVNMK